MQARFQPPKPEHSGSKQEEPGTMGIVAVTALALSGTEPRHSRVKPVAEWPHPNVFGPGQDREVVLTNPGLGKLGSVYCLHCG